MDYNHENEFITPATEIDLQLNCLKDRKWWVFVLSGIFTFLAAIAAVLIWRVLHCVRNYLYRKKTKSAPDEDLLKDKKNGFINELENWSQELLSERTITGKILEGLALVLGTVTFLIYVCETGNEYVENCVTFVDSPTQQVDLAINIFFLLYHVVLFMDAPDKLYFMTDFKSMVDYFTIPPFFISIYLQRTYTGFRFLRALHLSSVLKYLKLSKDPILVRILEIISMHTIMVLLAAGIIHLLENSGDPFEFANSQKLSYPTCMYFAISTMTTVGYGDVFCVTVLGRTFISFFMLMAPVLFYFSMVDLLNMYSIEERRNNNKLEENDTSAAPIQSDQVKGQENSVVNAINYFIASSNLPLATVEHKGFKNLIETMLPGFSMPSRTVFATMELPREMIEADLKPIEYISASLRGWKYPDRVVTFAISFISSEWELECRTLASQKFDAKSTADDVSKFICETLEKFNIPMEKISSMTTDTSPEIVDGINDLGICHIPCFTHVVNTFFEKIFSLRDIAVIVDKIDEVFNELEYSMEMQSHLLSVQKEVNESHGKLLSYSKNQCSSRLNRMDFVRTNEIAFCKFLTTYEGGKYEHLLLTTVEHQKNVFLLSLIRPVEEYTKLLMDGTSLTTSLISKLKTKICNSLYMGLFEPEFETFVAKLFSVYSNGCQFDLAGYFDPRISVDKCTSISVAVRADYETWKGNRSALETLIDEGESGMIAPLNDELTEYNLRAKIPFNANPLLWWKNETAKFPILSRICKKYLGIQAAPERSLTCTSLFDGTSINEKHLDFFSMNEKNVKIDSGLV